MAKMTNPYRDCLAELVQKWYAVGSHRDLIDVGGAMDRARALLAQPEPPELTDEEIDDWCGECSDLTRAGEADHYWVFGDVQGSDINAIVRAAYARWGCPAPPPREP